MLCISHMRAFAEALKADDLNGASDELASPASPFIGPSTPSGHRVRKVSALSDFAPVNTRVRRWVYLLISHHRH